MLYIFCAVNYYANLLIKPPTAQLHLYTLQHVSAATIQPSSETMFFLDKAARGTDKAAYGTVPYAALSRKNCILYNSSLLNKLK
jgi:hypothetical protein